MADRILLLSNHEYDITAFGRRLGLRSSFNKCPIRVGSPPHTLTTSPAALVRASALCDTSHRVHSADTLLSRFSVIFASDMGNEPSKEVQVSLSDSDTDLHANSQVPNNSPASTKVRSLDLYRNTLGYERIPTCRQKARYRCCNRPRAR